MAGLVQDAGEIQGPDGGDQQAPEHKDLVGGQCGGDHIAAQPLIVDLFPDGPEVVGKKLLGPQGQLVFDGDNLEEHVCRPDEPQQVQGRQALEKVHPQQDIKGIPPEGIQQAAQNQDDAAPRQPGKIQLSGFRHRIPLSNTPQQKKTA